MTKNDELKLKQGLRELGYSNETIKNCIKYENQKQERRERIYPSKKSNKNNNHIGKSLIFRLVNENNPNIF